MCAEVVLHVSFTSTHFLSPMSLNTSRDTGSEVRGQRSEVGVGEHGVLFPHGAETFNSVDKLLIKLRERERDYFIL